MLTKTQILFKILALAATACVISFFIFYSYSPFGLYYWLKVKGMFHSHRSVKIHHEKVAHTFLPKKIKKRAFIAYFGTLDRSIQYAWPSHKRHIIQPLLNNHYSVDIIAFNLQPDSQVVDTQPLDGSLFLDIIKPKHYDSLKQSVADENIIAPFQRAHCHSKSCRFVHPPLSTQNAFRQMVSESRLRKLIQSVSKSYDLGVVTGPDFYFLNTIDVPAIETALSKHQQIVFVSNFIPRSDVQVENGFYIGTPNNLAKILNMWNHFAFITTHYHCFNYERALGIASIFERLHLLHQPVAYVKIRNNQSVARMGPVLRKYARLENNKPHEIIDNLYELFNKHPELHIRKERQGKLKDHPLCQV